MRLSNIAGNTGHIHAHMVVQVACFVKFMDQFINGRNASLTIDNRFDHLTMHNIGLRMFQILKECITFSLPHTLKIFTPRQLLQKLFNGGRMMPFGQNSILNLLNADNPAGDVRRKVGYGTIDKVSRFAILNRIDFSDSFLSKSSSCKE